MEKTLDNIATETSLSMAQALGEVRRLESGRGTSVSYARATERSHSNDTTCSISADREAFKQHFQDASQRGEPPRLTIVIRYGSTSLLTFRQLPLEMAKEFADKEVRKKGHVCSPSCSSWESPPDLF
jgi:hypothetical protein